MIALASAGLAVVLQTSEWLFYGIKIVGAAYLLYLAWQLWTADVQVEAQTKRSEVGLLGLARQEFLVAAGNPKAILIFTAFLPQFVDPSQADATQFAVLGALFLQVQVGARQVLLLLLGAALGLSLCLFALIALLTQTLEKRRHGRLEAPVASPHQGWRRLLRGPWPLVWGAVALALLNFATLALAGRPWGITSAFALWGAKVASGLGVDVGSWVFWQSAANAKALAAPVWQDITSVMDIGIVLGALLAAGLAGRFAPSLKIPARSLVAAVIGGLLLGYGSRLAYGCNIGAYFSGIASGSLHGWLWLVAAFIGNGVGVRLRPWFFAAERSPQGLSGC